MGKPKKDLISHTMAIRRVEERKVSICRPTCSRGHRTMEDAGKVHHQWIPETMRLGTVAADVQGNSQPHALMSESIILWRKIAADVGYVKEDIRQKEDDTFAGSGHHLISRWTPGVTAMIKERKRLTLPHSVNRQEKEYKKILPHTKFSTSCLLVILFMIPVHLDDALLNVPHPAASFDVRHRGKSPVPVPDSPPTVHHHQH